MEMSLTHGFSLVIIILLLHNVALQIIDDEVKTQNEEVDSIEKEEDDNTEKEEDDSQEKEEDDNTEKEEDDSQEKEEDDNTEKEEDDSKEMEEDDSKDKEEDDSKEMEEDDSKDKEEDESKEMEEDDSKDKEEDDKEDDSKDKEEDDSKEMEEDDSKDKEEDDSKEMEEDDSKDKEEDDSKEMEEDDSKEMEEDDSKEMEEDDNVEKEEDDNVEKDEDDNIEKKEDNNIEKEVGNSIEKEVLARKPATFHWPSGTVPYIIKTRDYDAIIATRIRAAMHTIQSSSCVVFKDMTRSKPQSRNVSSPWLSIENPEKVRECSHTTLREEGTLATKAILIVGYDCMQQRDILHALLHALGLSDEVTHPQRDLYIRVVWPNIQPRYRSLFYMKKGETPQKMVEYDSMSIMHFHERAYTVNGGATILPQIPGLLIAPSDTLSQLDVMKLRLAFGHECNKRKVANLLRTCFRDNEKRPPVSKKRI